MARVDLNIDLGELDPEPDELYGLATVVNIACGGHAGDIASMKRSVAAAVRHGARIAAHPSYPDREQFGRARMAIPLTILYESIIDQMATLARVVLESGTALWGVKLHGALYHAASEDRQLAAAVLDAVVSAWPDSLTVVGPPWGYLESASRARELPYAREGFADRTYDERGRLVPRGEPNDVITDVAGCAEQAVRLARGGHVETICVHGDRSNAVDVARAVRDALEREHLLIQ